MNTLSERLHAVLALDPAAPAVEFDGAWSTWGELASAADAVDAALRATGLGAGSPVGLMLRNRPGRARPRSSVSCAPAPAWSR